MIRVRCERSTYVDKDTYHESRVVVCHSPGCPYTWCKTCIWETDSDTDEVARQHSSLSSCDADVGLRALMAEEGWRYCPGCRTPGERISGCDHMTVCLSLHPLYLLSMLTDWKVHREEMSHVSTPKIICGSCTDKASSRHWCYPCGKAVLPDGFSAHNKKCTRTADLV